MVFVQTNVFVQTKALRLVKCKTMVLFKHRTRDCPVLTTSTEASQSTTHGHDWVQS